MIWPKKGYQGAAAYEVDARDGNHNLLVGVKVAWNPAAREVERALVDTAAEWCVMRPKDAHHLEFDLEAPPEVRLSTRFGMLSGRLVWWSVWLLADEGQPVMVDATWFLSSDWKGPMVRGWKGGLERIRFAVDPNTETFYFSPL